MAVFVLAITCGTAIYLDRASIAGQASDFQITVRNITERQPFSPPIIVVHESNAVLLPSSAERVDGLEEFAESGSQTELMEALSQRSGVKRVERFGGNIAPQSQQTVLRVSAETGDYISVMAMLQCTNDAIVVGSAIISDDSSTWFGSGVVWDAGTEDNDESRSTVPCLEGEAVSDADIADGEGQIRRHPGIQVIGDLGAVFGWERTAMEIVIDQRGTPAKRAFEVGATLENKTKAQPITPPVVVVHDKNVDVLNYTRPRELPGIDILSEIGAGTQLMDTLASRPGVVSVTQWNVDGEIAPGESYQGNARAFVGNTISVLGMFACTNDGYIVASAEVRGTSVNVSRASSIATVFDSGAENNDETSETVPCLGGVEAGLSEGPGENGRREHPGIAGTGDLSISKHGWSSDSTAVLTLHNRVVEPTPDPMSTPTPEPMLEPTVAPSPEPTVDANNVDDDDIPPETGGRSLPIWLVFPALLAGLLTAIVGALMTRRRLSEL